MLGCISRRNNLCPTTTSYHTNWVKTAEDTITMALSILERLAFPGVVSLVCFLAYTSQWLFMYLEPAPLRKGEAYIFNMLVFSLLVCYVRTCFTDPGRIPVDWYERAAAAKGTTKEAVDTNSRQRYCRKCEMPKPPRAHHCKTCERSAPCQICPLSPVLRLTTV